MIDCVLWDGYCLPAGYGYRRFKGKMILAHRRAWIEANGPIPDGVEVHHTCENKACINVDHLELVTRTDHMRIHRRLSHCGNGHEFTPENTYWNGRKVLRRRCKACMNASGAAYRLRKKLALV